LDYPTSFEGMGKGGTPETHQSDHTPSSGPEIKDESGVPKMLCRTVQEQLIRLCCLIMVEWSLPSLE